MAPRRLPGPDLAGPDPVTERLFAVAVLAMGAVLAVVWAGAALAAVLGGTWPLPAGLGDAATALVRLPSHFARPAEAWPAPARAVLPGPVLYWPAQVVVVAGLAAAVVAGVRVWRRDRDTDGLGVDRSAAFAGRSDLGPLRVDGPVPGRLVLGRVGKTLVATEQRTSVCLVGPSGSGKTTGLCVPVLLEQAPGGGAVLAASVKGDVYNATQLRRASLGEVKVFDPTCSVVARSATWSPLRAAGTITGAQAAARALVDVASRGGIENGDFWMESATDLLWSLMFVAAGTDATMADVVRWVTTHDRPIYSGDGQLLRQGEVAEALGELTQGNALASAAEVKVVSESLGGIWSSDERTRSSIYSTARTVIAAWSDPVVARSAEGSEITPEWLLSGDNTLYVVAPARAQGRLRPVFSGLVADMVNEALDIATRCGGELDTKLLVLLDEAANICPVKELPAWCSTCASHGMTLVTVWQDRSQQRLRYGPEGSETIWNNSGAKVILSGLADKVTAEVAPMLGEEDYERQSSSLDLSGGRRSVSTQSATRRLVSSDSLRRQPPGQGLLVYKHLPAMRLHLRPWQAERDLRVLKERGR